MGVLGVYVDVYVLFLKVKEATDSRKAAISAERGSRENNAA